MTFYFYGNLYYDIIYKILDGQTLLCFLCMTDFNLNVLIYKNHLAIHNKYTSSYVGINKRGFSNISMILFVFLKKDGCLAL